MARQAELMELMGKRARVEISIPEKIQLLQSRIDEDLQQARQQVAEDAHGLKLVNDLGAGLKAMSSRDLKVMQEQLLDLSAYTLERVTKVMMPFVTRTGDSLQKQSKQCELEIKVLSFAVQQMLTTNICKDNGTYDFKHLEAIVDSAITFAEGREAANAMPVG